MRLYAEYTLGVNLPITLKDIQEVVENYWGIKDEGRLLEITKIIQTTEWSAEIRFRGPTIPTKVGENGEVMGLVGIEFPDGLTHLVINGKVFPREELE